MAILRISAGSYDLNKWLYGGYEEGIITTIVGPAGSGKTNFCILPTVSQAKKSKKVLFIDTEGGFSVERVKQVAGEKYEEVLKNILLIKPTSFSEQKKSIQTLENEIKRDKEISLIIVDGMTMLYRLELAEAKEGKKIKEVNSELARQMRILAEIARQKNIAVIITNQVYSEFLSEKDLRAGKNPQTKMVGGDILKYWSKCIIELENNRGKRKAKLKKHRSLPEKELNFYITNEGVKKRGWI